MGLVTQVKITQRSRYAKQFILIYATFFLAREKQKTLKNNSQFFIFSPSADKFSAKSNFYFLYNSLVLLIVVVVRYILFLHNLTFSGRHPSK